jgi:hypothetical protein
MELPAPQTADTRQAGYRSQAGSLVQIARTATVSTRLDRVRDRLVRREALRRGILVQHLVECRCHSGIGAVVEASVSSDGREDGLVTQSALDGARLDASIDEVCDVTIPKFMKSKTA